MVILTPSSHRENQKVRGIRNVLCPSMYALRVLSILHRGMGVNWQGDALGKWRSTAVSIRDR